MCKTLAIISPHFDDAALSCGGLMHTLLLQGWQVTVVNIFSGYDAMVPPSDFACYAYRGRDVYQKVARRANEDRAAAAHFGFATYHLDYPEACLRFDRMGLWECSSWNDVFQCSKGSFASLEEQIATRIHRIIREKGIAFALWPSSRDSHRDHAITSYAADAFVGLHASSDPTCISMFYEDLPYNARRGMDASSLAAFAVKVATSIDIEGKLAMIRRYPHSLMVGSASDRLEGIIVDHARSVAQGTMTFAERFAWRSDSDRRHFENTLTGT